MADLKKLFENVPRGTRHVGDADSGVGLVAQSIFEAYPGMRLVAIHRPIDECVDAEWNALTWDGNPAFDKVTKSSLAEVMRRMSLGIAHLWNCVPENRKLMVPFGSLESKQIIREVWDFCLPNTPFHEERYEMLQDLRITQIPSKVLRRHPDQPFRKLVEAITEKV